MRCGGIGIWKFCPTHIAARRSEIACLQSQFHQKIWRSEAFVANLLKAELKRKGVTYAQLAQKFADIGIVEAEVNIRNKLAEVIQRGVSGTCLKAIGVA